MEGLHPLLVCHDSYLMDSEEKNWVLGVGAGGGFFNLLDGGISVRCCTSLILLGDLPGLQFRDDFVETHSLS